MESPKMMVLARRGAGLLFLATVASAILAASPSDLAAQRRRPGGAGVERLRDPGPSIGVRAGYDFDVDAADVGAQARLPLTRRLELIPSGDLILGDGHTDWQLNADLALRLGRLGGLYAGTGLGVLSRDLGEAGGRVTRIGPNAFLGLQLPGMRLPVRPFIEARWTFVESATPIRLMAGVNVPLGRPARR